MKPVKKSVQFIRDKIYSISRERADATHRNKYANDYLEIDRLIDEYLASLNFVKMEKKKKNQAYKLWFLRNLLEKHKPQNILEFGSGSSSVIIKDYAKRNGVRFTSVDESEDWAAQARRYICEPGNDSISVITRAKVYDLSQDPPSIKYEGGFEGNYDFVFIDGPSLTSADGEKIRTAANKDVFDLQHLPKVIVVDGRESTARLIHKQYKDKYHSALSALFGKRYVGNDYNYLSVFVRKD